MNSTTTTTPTPSERRAAIEAARRHVAALAAGFRERAAAPGASEVDRLQAETAALVVELATMRARLIERAEAEALVEEARRRATALWLSTNEEIARLIRAGHTDLTGGPIKETIDRAVAATERMEAEASAWHDAHELATWQAAAEELTLLATGRDPTAFARGGDEAH